MNCLYTVNVGSFLTNASRCSFLGACRRWGCDYAELMHACVPGYVGTTKLIGPARLCSYSKLLYLDADMVVSDHSPNPFPLCSDGEFCVVTDCQAGNPCEPWRRDVYNAIENFAKSRPDLLRQPEEESFNAGLMLFSPSPNALAMFSNAIRMCGEINPTPYQEQAILNLCAYNSAGLKVKFLPVEWNHMVVNGSVRPDYFINHYGGSAQALLKTL